MLLTYRVRPRVFRPAVPGGVFAFPNSATINLHFQPRQPFGEGADRGRTAFRAASARLKFDANSGKHYVASAEPLRPLGVTLEAPARRATVRGAKLTVVQEVQSMRELLDVTERLYYAMPMLLAIEFADPPFVERVDGSVGGAGFTWELEEWSGYSLTTTQELQEAAVARAWERFGALAEPERHRLLVALHYFHTGSRLLAASATPGEFLPEALLNFGKVLEVLFPGAGQRGFLDAARKGLRELGFRDVEIDARFVPAISLRNKVDVGHADFTLFAGAQLTILHQYAESAERNFKGLFERIFECLAAGTFRLRPGYPAVATAADQNVVARVAVAMAQDSDWRTAVSRNPE